jgi:hypothetical protein
VLRLDGAQLFIRREFTAGGGGFGYGKRGTLFKSQRDSRRLPVPGELKNNAGNLILRIGRKAPRGLKASQKFCHAKIIYRSECA